MDGWRIVMSSGHLRQWCVVLSLIWLTVVRAGLAADLDVLWSADLGSPVSASPTLLPDGTVLIGTQGTPDPDTVNPNAGGRLLAYTLQGQIRGGTQCNPVCPRRRVGSKRQRAQSAGQ
jgi:hypothetical protein